MFTATVTFTDGTTVTDNYPDMEAVIRTAQFALSGLTVHSLKIDTGRELLTRVALYSVVTDQGTACAEATLCQRHFTPERKEILRGVVGDEGKGWENTSNNPEVACAACGAHNTH